MHNQAAQAYQTTSRNTGNPRELEASLLLRAAARLQAARDQWTGQLLDLDTPLVYNRKLWTVLVTSVMRPENPLPDEIKKNILNLAVFIFGHTMKVMAEPKPESLNILITINRNIAEGLRN